MIKIVKAPLQLEPFLNEFKDLFTKPSYSSFRDLCGALSVCDKSKTVANLCDTMAECSKKKKARSSYNWFLSDANWDENEVAQRKVDLFIEHLCLKENDKMLLIIDDTFNEKEGTQTEGVGKFYDHSKKPTFGATILLPLLSKQRGYSFHIKPRCISRITTKMRILEQKWRLPSKRLLNP